MIPRYKTEENRQEAETIYKLRQQGYSYQAIAEHVGQSYQTAIYKYKRECHFRKQAFHCPFIEYISGRTEKVIRQSLGENLLAEQKKLSAPAAVKAILFWPGAGDATLKDLAEGLAEAGFESFDPVYIKTALFYRPQRFNSLRQ